MNRKDFIRTATLSLIPFLAKPSFLNSIDKNVDNRYWNEILRHAVLCPSVHNIQPWAVKIIDETTCNIYFDSDKQLPYADKTSAFMTMTMAMFTETIRKIANSIDYDCNVEYQSFEKLPLNEGLVVFAVVRIEKCKKITSDFNLNYLYNRRTARFGYLSNCISEKIVSEISQLTANHQRSVSFTQNNETIKKIKQLETEALFDDLYDDSYREELKPWIRTHKDESLKKDGLSAICLGQPDGITKNFFENNSRYQSDFKKYFLKQRHYHSLRNTHFIFWLKGSFSSYQQWLESGELLIDLWLLFAKHNLYIQPFGNLITNESAHIKLTKNILNEEETTWFIARLGYCATPPASIRKTVKDIII